ncbi:hypothetical protein ACLKA7_008627 [Drosophila subpalustris]
MDEDNNDVPRVTRARTRRLSTLDVDSRSSTPLLDATVERASPRPMRRTRLNSATIEVRTPTRSTRLSVARGETPEPITPNVSLSATKRGTRTPAKSVRKAPLPLKEELLEEGNEEPIKEIKKEIIDTSHDRRVTRAMSKTPPDLSLLTNTIPQPKFDINNSLEDKQTKEVIENVDMPPVIVEQLSKSDDGENKTASITSSLNNNKPTKLQVKLKNISMDKPGDSPAETDTPKSKKKNEETVIDKGEPKAKEDAVQEDSDTPTEYNTPDVSIEEVKAAKVRQEEPDKANEDIVQVDDSSPEKTEPQANATQEVNTELNVEPVVHNVEQIQDEVVVVETDKETSLKEPDSQTECETPKSVDEIKPVNIHNNEEPVIVQTEETNKNDEIAKDDEPCVVDNDVTMEELVVPPDTDPIVEVIEDILLPALTPRIMSRVAEAKPVDANKKSVGFGGNTKVQSDDKPIYPKTPARLTPTNVNKMTTVEEKDIGTKTETPLKGMFLKKRYSSTPLAKSDESSGVNPPPLQIDVIESLVDMEKKSIPEIQSNKEMLARRLVNEDEQDEEEEEDDERDGEPGICEFFDNEVEVVDNYVSGDSMDSSERREILENQIPHDGESVGSQDTTEDDSEESEGDNLSFIVSDNDVEEGNDGDDIEELCFSPEPESEDSNDAKGGKKRRRIIVHDTSDEDDDKDVTAEKDSNRKEQSLCESMNKSKNATGIESKIKEKSFVKDSQDTVKPEKSDSLIKAASVQGDDPEIEEVHSSSDEGEEHEHEKSTNNNNKSIYEVPDSSDESSETEVENSAGNSSPTKANKLLSQEKEKSILKEDSPTPMAEEEKVSIPDAAEKTVESTSKSSAFHNKEKREDEAALLDELSSCKLTHLQQMFNPLQKSRRQTLYHQGPEMSDDTERKPKMKRRSEQLNSDVKPSQSFIETLAEEKSQRLKRKHMSKSFCGTADDLDTSAVQEVKSKKAKKTCDAEQADQEESSTTTANVAELKAPAPAKKPSDSTKDTAFYLDYCDSILQAANEAMLEQKKQRVASGKKTKTVVRSKSKTASDALEPPRQSEAVAPVAVAVNPEFEKATKIKKDVKRLQATKQAVKHAIQLLVPELAKKEPQSLARKLSPQPQVAAKAKNTKVKKQIVKGKKPQAQVVQVSPAKSSDEENRHAVKRIKTSAGYFVESEIDSDGIELIKTRSGIMKCEPCTPTQKYFKEVPSTPYNRSGFAEHSAASKAARKKLATGGQSNVNRNPATESALRFKREIFGRSSK